KRSARDAHAAIRQYTARRRCGGAQVGLSPSRLREWGVEVGLPTLFCYRKNFIAKCKGVLPILIFRPSAFVIPVVMKK
ncbi:hypothetical protein RUMHYD_01254, partial [Blautia hydrogenotrophica DSM 10507]